MKTFIDYSSSLESVIHLCYVFWKRIASWWISVEKLEYRWFLNDSAYGYHMTENVTDVLIIEAIMIRQAGAYTCRIRNVAGWTRHSHAMVQEVIVEGEVAGRTCLTDNHEILF